MTPGRLRSLVLLHADMIREAAWCERAVARASEPERAEMAADQAAEWRERAAALAELLEPQGVVVPDPRQLSLLSDGGSPA